MSVPKCGFISLGNRVDLKQVLGQTWNHKNNTYLYAPDIPGYHFHYGTSTKKLTGNYLGILLLFSAFYSGIVAQCVNLFMSDL